MPHQPVMHRMLMMPAMPLTQFHQPPYSQTFSLESHQRVPVSAIAMAPRMPDSKSLATAIRILMATMAKGERLKPVGLAHAPLVLEHHEADAPGGGGVQLGIVNQLFMLV